MTTQTQVLKLALEALERIDLWLKARYSGIGLVGVELDAITSIKEALAAQPEHLAPAQGWKLVPVEPTPEMLQVCDEDVGCKIQDGAMFAGAVWSAFLEAAPHPPQRKPLTDEEIGAILEGVNAYGTRLYTFARAIEAAHGIKE